MASWWVVRAGKNAVFLEDFLTSSRVSISSAKTGDLSNFKTKQEISSKLAEMYPDWKPGKWSMWAGQLFRFAHKMQKGDWVLTYDPQQRQYHIGTVSGDYLYQEEDFGPLNNHRNISWSSVVSRDDLSTSTKNSLGAISSLFKIPESAGEEIHNLLSGKKPVSKEDDSLEDDADEQAILEDIESRAVEFTKDRLSKLDWEEMQELVAGILRAMGYKTRISPNGPDRGKDIVASPDGFGFESPRIVVEVKHREKSAMNSQAIRSFLGGRHQDDKGLFVSTGGFTKDAYYEAERANIPLTLMTMDELVRALIENYEGLDIETRQLVPLKKIFWPV